MLLFVITLITFIIFTVLPAADPALLRAGRQPSPELIASIRQQFGLSDPKPVQFFRYVGQILPFVDAKGDQDSWLKINFGYSFQSNALVLPQIVDRMGPTLMLTAGAVVIWLLVGIPIGMISAVKTGSWLDRLTMTAALIAISAPVYFLGLVALFLFDKDIGRFPLLPGSGALQEATTLPGKFGALLMPWCVLAASFAAVYARFLRGNLIDTLQEDYIRTARAKGLSERRVIFRHGVRAAVTPIVTLLGLDIGILLGGAILTETVFNIQGIGRFAYDAIVRFDLPVIQGTVLFGAFFIVTMSLIVDILYAFVDPRVRY
ncbi:MAG: peptide/nickel transport system permease protein [Solirubrobacteraceae bacterium]|nr:peptide/nickel transport system permease protein [Solirubrobacteraceae bacterium]